MADVDEVLFGGAGPHRTDKSRLVWEQTKRWCLANPGKTAMIASPQGGFVLTWKPKDADPPTKALITFLSENGDSSHD